MDFSEFIILPSARFLIPLQAAICHELVRMYGSSILTLPSIASLLQPLREALPVLSPSSTPSAPSPASSSFDVKKLSKTELTIGEGWSYSPPPMHELFPARSVTHPSVYVPTAATPSPSSSAVIGTSNHGGMIPTTFPGALRRSAPSWYYIASQTTFPSAPSPASSLRSRL